MVPELISTCNNGNGILAGKRFCANRTNVMESFPRKSNTGLSNWEITSENVYCFAF
jgi:hypothetical protein